jgi:hypothetical protein
MFLIADFEQKFETLMMNRIWFSVQELIMATRDYDNALITVEALMQYLENKRDTFKKEQYERYDKKLITFRLNLLEVTDRWEEYVDYYNQILNDRPNYYVEYCLERNDPIFNKFIRWTDKWHHVHFLYLYHYRYDTICRKLAKVQQRKRLGNLYHAKQSDLTDEELHQRYDRAMQLIKQML